MSGAHATWAPPRSVHPRELDRLQSEPLPLSAAPPPCRPTKVNLACQSSSSGEDPPHSPAFPPTKEDVEFVKRYILGGRAIAFRRAQDAARLGTARRGLLALAPLRPPQKSAASQIILPFQRVDIFGPSAIFWWPSSAARAGPSAPPLAATPFLWLTTQ